MIIFVAEYDEIVGFIYSNFLKVDYSQVILSKIVSYMQKKKPAENEQLKAIVFGGLALLTLYVGSIFLGNLTLPFIAIVFVILYIIIKIRAKQKGR